MSAVTPQVRSRMVLALERELRQRREWKRAVVSLLDEMDQSEKRIAAFTAAATGMDLLTLPYRQHETLPRVREDALP